MTDKPSTSVDRRSFLAAAAGAAGAASAATAAPIAVTAAPLIATPPAIPAAASSAAGPGLIRPSTLNQLAGIEIAQAANAQAQVAAGSPGDPNYHVANPGSDFMVDCLKALGYEYVAATPGSTFRGFQESVINYPGTGGPEWLTATHEEISAAMAHGYAKASGKPMAFAVHGVVGVQHAAMGVYQG